MTSSSLATATLVRLGHVTNRTFVLPLLIFYPTGRCNSRCVSCDWWKQSGADDLTLDEIAGVAEALPALGTRMVVFSGGEPLLRPEVFDAAQLFRAQGMTLHLLTSGVLLERFADRVAQHFSRVIVSLDATTAALYEQIRGVDALATVGRGVARLRRVAPDIPLSGRATLHRYVALCNQQLPQSALGSKTPLQAMKDWHTLKPDLFRKQPYFLTGCDSDLIPDDHLLVRVDRVLDLSWLTAEVCDLRRHLDDVPVGSLRDRIATKLTPWLTTAASSPQGRRQDLRSAGARSGLHLEGQGAGALRVRLQGQHGQRLRPQRCNSGLGQRHSVAEERSPEKDFRLENPR